MTTVCGHCLEPLDRENPATEWICPACERSYPIPEGRSESEHEDPVGFSVRTDGPTVTIRRRWAWPMGVIALILGGAGALLVGVFSLHTSLTAYTAVNLLIGAPFILGTLFCLYVGAAFVLNTTRIDVRNDTLTVRHGPVPWPGGLRLPLEGLRTFEVERLLTKTLSGKDEHGKQTNLRYRVRARGHQGRNRIIVAGLPEARPAERIRDTLTRRITGSETPPVDEANSESDAS